MSELLIHILAGFYDCENDDHCEHLLNLYLAWHLGQKINFSFKIKMEK